MNERLKKVLFMVGFVCLTVGIGFLIYRVFFKEPQVLPGADQTYQQYQGQLPGAATGTGLIVTSTEAGTLPEQGTLPGSELQLGAVQSDGKTTILSTNINNFISMSADKEGIRSYNPVDGKFYKVLDDGTSVPLSAQTFFNVEEVDWGNKTDKAILTYPDGSKILYDFANEKQVTLPSYWEDFNFSPQDNQIAAKSIGNNETNRFLVISNPDGTDARPIAELGQNQDKVHVSWSPNDQTVAYSFTGEPIGFDRQAVVMVGKHQENLKNLIVEGRGFVPNWSPTGNNLLYSVYNSNDGYRPTLWISGAAGDSINDNRRSIPLNTWADKCAWQNEKSVICAVPTQLGAGAGLQRDLFATIPDDIYRIDLQSGKTIKLGQPQGSPTITSVVLSPDGSSMYYNDRTTGNLAKFSLR